VFVLWNEKMYYFFMQNITSFFYLDFEMKYDLVRFLWNIYRVILCSCINTQNRKIGRSVWDYCENRPAMCRVDRGHMITCHTKATKGQEEIKFLTILPLSLSLSLTHTHTHTPAWVQSLPIHPLDGHVGSLQLS